MVYRIFAQPTVPFGNRRFAERIARNFDEFMKTVRRHEERRGTPLAINEEDGWIKLRVDENGVIHVDADGRGPSVVTKFHILACYFSLCFKEFKRHTGYYLYWGYGVVREEEPDIIEVRAAGPGSVRKKRVSIDYIDSLRTRDIWREGELVPFPREWRQYAMLLTQIKWDKVKVAAR